MWHGPCPQITVGYIFIDSGWSKVHMSVFCYVLESFSTTLRFSTLRLHLEVFPACVPAISPFGQCILLWNCPEEHWQ